MCKAIKEMLRVSRQEGEQEGRQEGRQKGRLEGQDGMATLSEKLILADRVSKLLKASTDREYRNKLLVEFGIHDFCASRSGCWSRREQIT